MDYIFFMVAICLLKWFCLLEVFFFLLPTWILVKWPFCWDLVWWIDPHELSKTYELFSCPPFYRSISMWHASNPITNKLFKGNFPSFECRMFHKNVQILRPSRHSAWTAQLSRTDGWLCRQYIFSDIFAWKITYIYIVEMYIFKNM